jgi:hypothetical protein
MLMLNFVFLVLLYIDVKKTYNCCYKDLHGNRPNIWYFFSLNGSFTMEVDYYHRFSFTMEVDYYQQHANYVI